MHRPRLYRWRGLVIFTIAHEARVRSIYLRPIGITWNNRIFFVCEPGNFSFIWISGRSFSRCSIGARIDATLWRVRMISIKRVYPNRRGVGSGAMRVDGTSEYEISRRYDASETATRDDHRGWRRVNSCAVSWERTWISPFGVWMSLVTIAVATWGYSSPTLRGCCRCFLRTSLCNVPAALPCAIKCRLCGQVFVNVGRLNVKLATIQVQKEGLRPSRLCIPDK